MNVSAARPPASPLSTAPAWRRALRRTGIVAVLVCLALAWPAYHFFWRHHAKRLQALRPGVFYRVAQPSEWGLRYLADKHDVRTIISLRYEDGQLREGIYDLGRENGALESEYVTRLGLKHVQWPMGREACWPFPTPWQFEEFFKLVDDPANHPIVIHCMGGRHRTGTLSALFRLEYDRWPIEDVLAEMYSFPFGTPIPLQEYNLRTYLPRPHPHAEQWTDLQQRYASFVDESATEDYETLVRGLLKRMSDPHLCRQLTDDLEKDRPFVLPLAQRLVTNVNDPLGNLAAVAAARTLRRPQADFHDWAMAAALIADFGDTAQQQELTDALAAEMSGEHVSPRYRALAAGVANRYTPNRIAFIALMLDDERLYPDPGPQGTFRYCDLALVRLAAILDQRFISGNPAPPRSEWDAGRAAARRHLGERPQMLALSRLLPPTGNNQLDGTTDSDERPADLLLR